MGNVRDYVFVFFNSSLQKCCVKLDMNHRLFSRFLCIWNYSHNRERENKHHRNRNVDIFLYNIVSLLVCEVPAV